MCGILCCITTEANVVHPQRFSPLVNEGNSSKWECDDAQCIKKFFINVDLQNDLKLSTSDQNKLANLDELRTLNDQIIKLNNVIKITEETESARRALQTKIDDIVGVGINDETVHDEDIFDSLVTRISSRGPDYLKYLQFYHSGLNFQLFSSVLSLRQPFFPQPIQNHGIVLQFNGELYNQECLHSNDTEFIMNRLLDNMASYDREDGILRTVTELVGEFAFTIHDLIGSKIYFGRDYIGRRSLLYDFNKSSSEMVISSLPPGYKNSFIECKSYEIMILNTKSLTLDAIGYETLWETYNSSNKLVFNPQTTLFDFNQSINNKLLKLGQYLNNACDLRQSTIQPLHPNANESNIGILFSGGLDCTVLASLISKNLRDSTNAKIDLITVGFDNPRTNLKASESPDRKLSKKSWFNLCKLYNSDHLTIRLVEINVDYKEWLINKKRVEKLMYPCNTEMDLSIAIAFYFASKCESGIRLELVNSSVSWDEYILDEARYLDILEGYTSNAKVLFSGLGADELFAGYSRHESIFNSLDNPDESNYADKLHDKYNELSASLIHDIKIIHERNLGRDDRVISSWGKELRYPYLDEKLINFVINDIEPNLKFKFNWELVKSKKKGERLMLKPIRKFLLREMADNLCLYWVKDELKRAIQFGAKSAKMEIGQNKVKGTDNL